MTCTFGSICRRYRHCVTKIELENDLKNKPRNELVWPVPSAVSAEGTGVVLQKPSQNNLDDFLQNPNGLDFPYNRYWKILNIFNKIQMVWISLIIVIGKS